MSADRLIRWTAVVAVLAVAAVAGWVSYWHCTDLVTAHGEPGTAGHLYAATLDGLIIASSMVLLDAARHRGESAPRLAWWMLAAGIGATLVVNVLAGLASGWLGALIAGWPAGAFVASYELLMMLVRASSRRASSVSAELELPQVSEVLSRVPSSAESAAEASMRATAAVGNPWSVNALATKFSLSRPAATEIRERVLAESTPERGRDSTTPAVPAASPNHHREEATVGG